MADVQGVAADRLKRQDHLIGSQRARFDFAQGQLIQLISRSEKAWEKTKRVRLRIQQRFPKTYEEHQSAIGRRAAYVEALLNRAGRLPTPNGP